MFTVGGSLPLSACATKAVAGSDPSLTVLQMRDLPTPHASDLVGGPRAIAPDRLVQ